MREAAERDVGAAEEDLSSLLYAVSHDLGAPLRAVEGFSSALLEDFGDTLDPRAADYARRVHDAAVRLQRAIDGLVALSRVDRAPIEPERVDLSAVARDVGAELRRAAPDRALDLVVADGLEVTGDRALTKRLLTELLDNAWKFTRPHATARVEVAAEERDGERVFSVRDDGVGFEPAHAQRLFQPLQTLHAPPITDGVGVGLAIARRIVRRHGGWIRAEGSPEGGATFWFTLGAG